MWKKNGAEEEPRTEPSSQPISPVQQLKERAVIGRTITVNGEISGKEDLVIHGTVQGNIRLPENNLTIGEKGSLEADAVSKIISVEGTVQGNLQGKEQVILRRSARVRGNIAAPRVTLEDGCTFTGGIDMESGSKGLASKADRKTHKPDRQPASEALAVG